MGRDVVLDGKSLTMDGACEIAEQEGCTFRLSPDVLPAIHGARRQVEEWVRSSEHRIYGLNTGLGPLKDVLIAPSQQVEFQKRILLSHSVTVGEPWPAAVVRLAMLLRANVFARGQSGVTEALIRRILTFLEHDVTPVVGSLGALGLGDLPPMAEIGLSLAGMAEGTVRWRGTEGSAPDILAMAGVTPISFEFTAGEALSLVDGSTMTLAAAAFAVRRARRILALADLAAALTLESVRGETAPFDPRVHLARPHPGQIAAAEHFRALLRDSQRLTVEARSRWGETVQRVQDAISLRSAAQVHGAALDTLFFAERAIEREINASTDNPLVLPDGAGGYVALPSGNFHAAPVAYACDFLTIALTDVFGLSERRSSRLLDPELNFGLPANLVSGELGVNTGLAVAQSAASALLGVVRTLASPATGDSRPLKHNQEDHASMGTWAAQKLLQVVTTGEWILDMEVLTAYRALGFQSERLQGFRLGAGTQEAYDYLSQWLTTTTAMRSSRRTGRSCTTP